MNRISRLFFSLLFAPISTIVYAEPDVMLKCNVTAKDGDKYTFIVRIYPESRKLIHNGNTFTESGIKTLDKADEVRFDKILEWKESSIAYGDDIHKNGVPQPRSHVYYRTLNRLTGAYSQAYIGGDFYSVTWAGVCEKVVSVQKIF